MAFTVASDCSSISQWPESLIDTPCTLFAPTRISIGQRKSEGFFPANREDWHRELTGFQELPVVDRILIERRELRKARTHPARTGVELREMRPRLLTEFLRIG